MTGFHDPDDALAKIQRDIAHAQDRADRAAEVKASIDRVRGRARSPRGEVSAEVDPAGMLTDLQLADAALDLTARALADLIRSTVRAAGRDAASRTLAVATDAYGEQSGVTGHLRGELEARWGAPDGAAR